MNPACLVYIRKFQPLLIVTLGCNTEEYHLLPGNECSGIAEVVVGSGPPESWFIIEVDGVESIGQAVVIDVDSTPCAFGEDHVGNASTIHTCEVLFDDTVSLVMELYRRDLNDGFQTHAAFRSVHNKGIIYGYFEH